MSMGGILHANESRQYAPHILQSMITQYWEKHDWLIDYFMLDYLIDMAVNHYPDVKKINQR